MENLNEIKGMYNKKFGKKKAIIDEEKDQDPKEQNCQEDINKKEIKNLKNKKSSSKKAPGLKKLLNSEEVKEDAEIVKNVTKKKKSLKAKKNCEENKIDEKLIVNNELNLDTAQKNNNNILNINNNFERKKPDTVRFFEYIILFLLKQN